jgi:hypothetical protein
MSPVWARVIGEAAIVRYRRAMDIDRPSGRDQGEFWRTDYWERLGGRWRAVGSDATRIVVRDA